MKPYINTLKYIAITVLCISISSCKKDKDREEDKQVLFDINKAADYYIYAKYKTSYGGNIESVLFDFQPENEIRWWTLVGASYASYSLAENIIKINHYISPTVTYAISITINNGKVTAITAQGSGTDMHEATFYDIAVVRKPGESVVGRTFTGSYLKADGSVLHQNFYYRFTTNNTIEAGFNPESTERTETTFTHIGNIGRLVTSVSNIQADRELMLLINGKLEVSYFSSPGTFYHGTFTEKK